MHLNYQHQDISVPFNDAFPFGSAAHKETANEKIYNILK